MLTRRVIACLDVAGGRVVKGVRFEALRDVGDPADLAVRYEQEGADEVVLLDIGASHERRGTCFDVVRRTAERLFIPLTVGGGIASWEDVGRALRAGADKITINSAAVRNPGLLTEAADRFGAQCVVASVDAKRRGNSWEVYVHGGRQRTGLDAVCWARECVSRGAGEILLTSIESDGTRAGYDVALTAAVADAVSVPVIASGGAGSAQHAVEVLQRTGANAVLLAGILHDGVATVREIKTSVARAGLRVRAA